MSLTGLRADAIRVDIRGRTLLEEVSVEVAPGRVTSIVGPNGAGKSTLLRALAGELGCAAGALSLEGRSFRDWPLCDHARRRAVLPQHSTPAFDMPVEAVVELGRMPHHRRSTPRQDAEIVLAALERVGALHLRGRAYPTLSGGERQRVQLARTLAQIWTAPDQGSRYLLLDEPLSAQDLGRQHQIMHFVRELAGEGVGVLVVVHDLNLAARYSDELLLLHRGRTLASGTPREVLTPDRIRHAFGLDAVVAADPVTGTPLVIATGSVALDAPTPSHDLFGSTGAPS